jgi:hypothetical protein
MKKFGILIFIVTILVGVVFANLFSFGKASGKLFNFSFLSAIKGSAVAGSEVRNVSGFKGVDVGGIFQVEVTVGKDFAVEVEADDNLLQYIKTEVEHGVLKIETTERINSHTPMRIRISAPDIESVGASGACKVSVAGVKNSALNVDTSGASKIKVAGETQDLNIEVSGASNIDAESLKAQTATVDASGASKVSVFVTERLTSDASGASRIAYSGNPTSVDKKTSGASSVSPK